VGVKGWTVVYEGQRLQADIVGAALEAEGLQVVVFGDNIYGAGIDFTPARIMVPDGQATTARRLIQKAEAAASEPDAEEDV
jgi:putative signal transducing protein